MLCTLATILFHFFPEASYLIHLFFIAFVVFAFYQLSLSKDIKEFLERIERKLPFDSSSNPPPNEGERGEEGIRTSGGGALVGMVIGGLLGLPLGLGGLILGGVLGALIGNQLEYKTI